MLGSRWVNNRNSDHMCIMYSVYIYIYCTVSFLCVLYSVFIGRCIYISVFVGWRSSRHPFRAARCHFVRNVAAMMTAVSDGVVFKQFLLIQVTRMPREFVNAMLAVFGGRWHRCYRNRELGDWHEGAGIICEDCYFPSLFGYAEDCGTQLGRHHILVQFEHLQTLFTCIRSMRSRTTRLDVRQKGPTQCFHVVLDVQ